jgi:UDP-glucose 4-epimerase
MIPAELTEPFGGKRVLITGGLGFVGSHLARALASAGSHVTIIDSLVPEYGGRVANVADVEHLVDINISDVRDVHSLPPLIAGQDYLFNLAGQTSHFDSMRDPYTDLEINCRSQLSILEACRQHNPEVRVIFASTRQIYGSPQYIPVDERHPIAPVDVNGINKTAGEWYHLLYGNVYGIPVAVLRMTNTYGPYMRAKDARQTFLGYWFRLLVSGQQLKVFGDGTQRRDFTYVDDAVRAFLLAALREEATGEVYNLGDERVISLRELAELLIKVNEGGSFELVPFPAERKVIDIGDYAADYSKIRRQLGWEPSVSLEDGLRESLEFYREHGSEFWDDEPE